LELHQIDVSDENSIMTAAEEVNMKHGWYVSVEETDSLISHAISSDALVNNVVVGDVPDTSF
jgi:hypothetical protein